MKRFASLLLAMLLGSCSRANSCPTVDEERLARALAAEILTRAEANSDAPGDDGSDDVGTERYRVPVEGHPVLGPADARVTLVAFSDFECPFCSRVRPTLDLLRAQYGDRLRIVFFHRPLPFHRNAMLAAEAANEAYVQGGDDAFFRMAELLFDAQRSLDPETIDRIALEVGLAMPRFREALASHVHRPTVEADNRLAETIGASGTPTFFINGVRFVGAQPLESFVREIDRELDIANSLVVRGVAPRDVYARLMQGALEHYVEPQRAADGEGAAAAPIERPDPELHYRVPIGGSARRGPDDALVTIVEFGDFECPFCARVMPTLDELERRYGADLRIVHKHHPLPFHAYARYSAATALEARDQLGHAAFLAMARRFWADSNRLNEELIDEIARDVGLDMDRLTASRRDGRHEAEILADEALAQRLGSTGTPAFFINGRYLPGAQPLEEFVELVDEELRDARALVASGVPRWQVYPRLVEKGIGFLGEDPVRDTATLHTDLTVAEGAVVDGPANARIVVQVVADLTSIDSARLEMHLDRLRTRFAGRIRLVYRDRPDPRNPLAMKAAEIGREVFAQRGIGGYTSYRRALLERGPAMTAADPERLAVSAGRANRTTLRRALTAGTHRAAIEADTAAIAAAHLDQRSLPIVMVGPVALTELRSAEAYELAISAGLGD